MHAPLTALIMEKSHQYTEATKAEQLLMKRVMMKAKRHRESQAAAELMDRLRASMQRAMNLSTEKGSSSWLCALPIAEHGFALHISAFRDANCLR